jgi:hypothetical protein
MPPTNDFMTAGSFAAPAAALSKALETTVISTSETETISARGCPKSILRGMSRDLLQSRRHGA